MNTQDAAIHTPGPWRVTERMIIERPIVIKEHISLAPIGGPTFAFFPAGRDARVDLQKANAAFIVRACNNHGALVDALEYILTASTNGLNPGGSVYTALNLAKSAAQSALANLK